jgi:glycosyltransferase involved in cell wall biosynthesis
MGVDGEIIVADNSSDRTPEIARSLGAKVVTPDKRGYGYAYLYGFRYARGKYIVIGDADNTYDFLEIPKLIEPLKNENADMVIGSRFRGEIKKGAMPWLHKYIGNPLLTWFLNVFFKAGVSDSHSGFRAFKRDVLGKMNLRCHGMEFASEMIIEASRKGLRIKEVPITYHPREGTSKLSSFEDGWRHLKFMLLQTPKYLYYIPGFILFVIGFLLIVLMNLIDVKVGGAILGVNSIIAASLLVIVGYQLIFLGLFSSVYGHSRGFFELEGLSRLVSERISLEKGALIGLIVFAIGALHALYLISRWINSGYLLVPEVKESILGMVLIVIGLQTIFFSFFLSMLGEEL